ncbi:hypothetical protein Rhopal_004211-T1 [Rhodotorula paludigena]|uniref:MFS transporter n=1 Tax=Rhodotorula paludigena TaxID=86838 RepID=A0AAV5GR93_9BASI|nr:hypothetical protein Rhopal_004211-T1 [Rhodotorula paludigena]
MDRQDSSDVEKASVHNIEEAALQGHAATDKAGHVLIHIDPAEEARLRRKIDIRILPTRANIGNARLAGLERDLGLSGYDYNILLTAFYCAYVVCTLVFFEFWGLKRRGARSHERGTSACYRLEFPAQMINKWIGPGKMIPILSFLFGLFSLCMAFVHSFGAAIALSRFYRKDELGFRLACYIVCAPLAGAVGGLLASGILKIDSIGPYTRWRNIFLVEGIITCGIAIISWFILPDRPEVCKWLTPEERALAEARIKAENVGSTHVVDALHNKAVYSGIFNVTTLLCATIFLFDNIVVQGVGFFLPTIIRTIYPDETTIQQQLRTVPPYVVGAFTTLLTGYLSFKTKKRGLYMVISAPFMILGYAMYIGSMDPQVRYAASFMVAIGAFSFGALCTAWAAANVTSDTARASALGTVVLFGNVGGLISTWTMLPNAAPRFLPGNAFNLSNSSVMLILSIFLWLYQIRENRAKENGRDDWRIEGLTQTEIEDLGQKHPGFRFRY